MAPLRGYCRGAQIIADQASVRPFFRDLYFRLSGPLDNPTVLIVLCVVCVAVLVVLRAWKR